MGKQVSAKKTPSQIAKNIDQMRESIQAQARCARYVDKDSLRPQVEKVYEEMTGNKFTANATAGHAARLEHARAHRLQFA